MTFNPDGSVHQPTSDDPPDTNYPYRAPATAPIGLIFAGLVVPGRPNLATAYALLEPAYSLTVIRAIFLPSGWAAAGAARLSVGNAANPTVLVDGKDLVGLTAGFGSDAILQIGPGNPLLVKVDGSPSAGLLDVYLVAAPTAGVAAGYWTDDSQTYRFPS
jgi:hypothetical protein